MSTWNKNKDGLPIVDYSSPRLETDKKSIKGRRGKHAERIDALSFKKFLKETESLDFDIMLEIKERQGKERYEGSQNSKFLTQIYQLYYENIFK